MDEKDRKIPKIGLAGVMCTPFRGDKEGNYASHRQTMEELATHYEFEFHSIDTGVYSLEDAEAAAAELEEWGADFILLQTSSFASGDFVHPFARMHSRLGLWAVPEGPPTSEGGLPLNSFTAMNLYNGLLRKPEFEDKGPIKWFYGDPGQELFHRRLGTTVQALRPLVNLPGKSIALIGGVAPSFDNLIIDPDNLYERLRVSVLTLDLDEVIERALALRKEDLTEILGEIKAFAHSIAAGQEDHLEKTARVIRSIQLLREERGFDAVAMSCWPQFQSDYQLAVCAVMGYLNQFGIVSACEGDVTSAISMLTLRYLSNGDVVTLMDLAAIDETDESILLWHCGPTAPVLADSRGATLQPLWLFDGPNEEKTGIHIDLVLKEGVATVLGFSTDFENMLILEGEIDPTKSSYIGSRGWMKGLRLNGGKIQIRELVQTLMVSGFQHHYPIGYGAWTNAALEYCGWLGINPIPRESYTDHLI